MRYARRLPGRDRRHGGHCQQHRPNLHADEGEQGDNLDADGGALVRRQVAPRGEELLVREPGDQLAQRRRLLQGIAIRIFSFGKVIINIVRAPRRWIGCARGPADEFYIFEQSLDT